MTIATRKRTGRKKLTTIVSYIICYVSISAISAAPVAAALVTGGGKHHGHSHNHDRSLHHDLSDHHIHLLTDSDDHCLQHNHEHDSRCCGLCLVAIPASKPIVPASHAAWTPTERYQLADALIERTYHPPRPL